MDLARLWLHFNEFINDFVKYGIPFVALGLSIVSFKDSRKANKVRDRLSELEEKIKKYELEEKEKEREEATKACVEARIIKISKGNYKMKVWNSGKATAYNVDFTIPQECKGMIWRDKVPYEFLESGKNFEEHVLVHFGTPEKFKLTTTWTDEQGTSYSKEQILTV
ncbi:hypothetical protein [Desulfosporosinus hippei]|uniref:Uncharacterized protein n=1 Tax=Desulfosporosinus hippei DSM 8344 TaxID=1121419 RepID=A0A1G8CF11_9FIRM|nr:hypothetical protein [Desulfosporosinus hippei]SDH44045.1 hypothetical protein SAMN05443529_11383 [Desulfosporosinus hippei DSM 8344]